MRHGYGLGRTGMSRPQRMRAGFIGVGMMGSGMAACLIRAGYSVTLLAHRQRAPLEPLIALGATEAGSAAELTASVDVIYSCMPNAEVVEALAETILPTIRPGQVWVDTTTSLPETSQRISQRMAETGAVFADAPVTGGPPQAASGDLASLIGCRELHYPEIRRAVAPYSRLTRRFGEPGTGNAAKLLNNLVTQGTMILLADAFQVAAKAAVDWETLHEVMNAGAARSGTLEKAVAPALCSDFDGARFTIANAAKDLGYALRLIEGSDPGRSAVASELCRRLQDLVASGRGSDFVSSMLDPSRA